MNDIILTPASGVPQIEDVPDDLEVHYEEAYRPYVVKAALDEVAAGTNA